jgi:hypothetical protein
MKIDNFVIGKELQKKLDSSSPELRRAIERKMGELGNALLDVEHIPHLPNNMRRPTHFKGHFRAEVNDDERLYWRLANRTILVFEDCCNHKEAERKYKDAHHAK